MPLYAAPTGSTALLVREEDIDKGTRGVINIHAGAGIDTTVADDSGSGEVDITIASTVSSTVNWAINPSDLGLLSYSFLPDMSSPTNQTPTAGTVYWTKLPFPATATVTNVHCLCTTAGTGTAAANVFFGLYTISGGTATRVLITADRQADFTSTGRKDIPFTTTTSVTGGAGVFVYIAYVVGTQFGTTSMGLGRSPTNQSGFLNGVMASSAGFFAAAGSTGQTTVPSSSALTSLTSNSFKNWLALS